MLAVDVDITPLVAAARQEDPEAWDQLLRRYQLPLFSFVAELVRHEQTSLDIVQETFISALRHLGSLREDARFGSWLFGIAHQRCGQYWRRANREQQCLEPGASWPDTTPAPENDPAEWLMRAEDEERFMSALAHLPTVYRTVLVLHFLEDFPLAEIAAIVGIPVGTVKSRLFHAKQQLRQLLEEDP